MKRKIMRMARCAMLFVSFAKAAVLLSGCEKTADRLTVYEENADSFLADYEDSGDEQREAEAKEIVVYVCGAVKRTGVYTLKAGSRICDAVSAAGGLLPDADATSLNQARLLADGEQIVVLSAEDAKGIASAGTAAKTGKVNINTADEAELLTLSGIGPAKARDIIKYRTEHGPFGSAEDIMKVSGIKSSLFEKIRDSITAG